MTNDLDYAGRFINATEAIKTSLEEMYSEKFKGVGEACAYALERNNRIIRQHKKTLRMLVDLRNIMQHSHVLKGMVIASPREDAVFAIEAIAEQVHNPPQIRTYMIKNPEVVGSGDSLAKIAGLIMDKSYSQLPVYDHGEYRALFTTNALARWLSEAVRRGEGDLLEEDVTISQIIAFSENYEQPYFVKPTESAYKVCDRLSGEEPVPAVLITTDGRSSGDLQGIVTRFDVPTIFRKITVDFTSASIANSGW